MRSLWRAGGGRIASLDRVRGLVSWVRPNWNPPSLSPRTRLLPLDLRAVAPASGLLSVYSFLNSCIHEYLCGAPK